MIAAILHAQWASMRNSRLGALSRGGLWTIFTNLVWYGFWAAMAFAAYAFTVSPDTRPLVAPALPRGLLFMLLYWQIAPILVASFGASLDLKKLRAYPIPHRSLFWVEVILRLTTGFEMVLLMGGSALGLIRNPESGWRRAPDVVLPLVAFVAFNLLLAAGMRSLIERLLAHKRLRELMVLMMVLIAAVPQVLIVSGTPRGAFGRVLAFPADGPWPWTQAAALMLGGAFSPAALPPWLLLVGWGLAAYGFGRWQFERSLAFDSAAARSEGLSVAAPEHSRADWFYRLPGYFLPDPIAAIVEKEIRSLLRAPRFRLVFIMGFTFGLIVWLPLLFGKGPRQSSLLGDNFLALLCVYALTLLGQVTYWNTFGFDRSAVQVYFSLPVPFSQTLIAKNCAAAFVIGLEALAVTSACLLLRMPVGPAKVVEAFLVTLVVALYLLSAGNLASVHMPRAMNPERAAQSGSGGKSQAMILFIYPLAIGPAFLAYLGRYAFHSEAAFFSVLGFFLVLGAVVYWIALESAVEAAGRLREGLITELSRSAGPVTAD